MILSKVDNLPLKLHKRYFENINHWLKTGGVYIGRTFLFKNDFPVWNMDKLMDYISNKKISNYWLNNFWTTGTFFLDKFYSRSSDVSVFIKRMDEYQMKHKNDSKGQLLKQLRKAGGNLFPPKKVWFTWMDKDFFNLIEPKFEARIVGYGKDLNILKPFKKVAPVFSLKKK